VNISQLNLRSERCDNSDDDDNNNNNNNNNNNKILFITFMQGMSSYIIETNHVPRVYSVAAVLYLQFVLRIFRP
jgi:hypothetical protein